MSETSTPNAGWEHLFQKDVFPPRYQTLAAPNESVVEWAETLPASSFVLDMGCGVGRHVVYLGKHGFKMAGTDISPTGVKRSQEACAEHGINFAGRVADMTALPWADETFDAVLSTATVCHHLRADIVKTLDEVWRVLKPGGLFLVDFLHMETLAYKEVLEQATAGKLVEVEPNTFVDNRPEPDMMDDAFLPHHYCDEDDVRDLLRSFEIIKLWADLPGRTADEDLPRRGYWVASVRK